MQQIQNYFTSIIKINDNIIKLPYNSLYYSPIFNGNRTILKPVSHSFISCTIHNPSHILEEISLLVIDSYVISSKEQYNKIYERIHCIYKEKGKNWGEKLLQYSSKWCIKTPSFVLEKRNKDLVEFRTQIKTTMDIPKSSITDGECVLWKFTCDGTKINQKILNNGIDMCISKDKKQLFVLENDNKNKKTINLYDFNLNIQAINITKNISENIIPSTIGCYYNTILFSNKQDDNYRICEFDYPCNKYTQIEYNKYLFHDNIERILDVGICFLICTKQHIALISKHSGQCNFKFTNTNINPWIDIAISADLKFLYILEYDCINEYCITSGIAEFKRTIISNLSKPSSMSLYYKNYNPYIIVSESGMNRLIDISLLTLEPLYYSLIDHSPFCVITIDNIIFCISYRDNKKKQIVSNDDINELVSTQLETNCCHNIFNLYDIPLPSFL